MALKNLKVTVTAQQTFPERTAPVRHEYYVPATYLLSLLDKETPETSGSGGDEGPHVVASGRPSSWALAAKKMKPSIEQRFSFGRTQVTKASGGYYMNVPGIDTEGVRERGGPSYNEFRKLISSAGTDEEVAELMLTVLGNPSTAIGQEKRAVAALIGAMFLAEPRRNKRALPINLMLLEFIKHGIEYGSKGNAFTWDRVLWRTSFGKQHSRDYQFEGGSEKLAGHERGGKLPMSHTGASAESTTAIPETPPNGTAFHFPNSELDKEATLVVRWLIHYLNKRYKDRPTTDERSTGGGWGTPKVVSQSTDYTMECSGARDGAFTYLNRDRKQPFAGTILNRITEALKLRCGTTTDLL